MFRINKVDKLIYNRGLASPSFYYFYIRQVLSGNWELSPRTHVEDNESETAERRTFFKIVEEAQHLLFGISGSALPSPLSACHPA